MSQQTDEETRSRGRPLTPEADLRAALAEATLTLLLKGGYGAATVDAVAKQAGVAKKTLYRFAVNRDDLVAQAVRSWTDAFQPAFEQDATHPGALGEMLEQGLQAIASQVLSTQAVGMFRRPIRRTALRAAGRPWQRGCSASSNWAGCASWTPPRPAICCWQ